MPGTRHLPTRILVTDSLRLRQTLHQVPATPPEKRKNGGKLGERNGETACF
jgi:hypothetical protein